MTNLSGQKQEMRKVEYSPPPLDQPKVTVNVGNSEVLRVGVQVVKPKGGETNLHSHPALDSCWFVLSGKARFYGYGDVLFAEAERHEGVFIPKGVPYWFEAAGDEPLEIMHITALDRNLKNERVDYAPPRERQAERGGSRGRAPTDEELKTASGSVSAL